MINSQFNLKVKFDTAFDELFYNNNFKNEMLNKFKVVPAGLTFDTRFDDDVSEPYFVLCCKKYGYEYSGEHVIGDYTINKYKFSKEMFDFCMDYLSNLDSPIYHEIMNYEFTF